MKVRPPGFVRIDYDLLRLVLDLPPEVTILGVRPSSREPHCCEIVVAGDRVPAGGELTLVYRTVEPGRSDIAALWKGKELQEIRGLARV